MTCDRCGSELSAEANFCTACGTTVTPPKAPKRGLAGHLKRLGILWIVYALGTFLSGVLVLTLFGGQFMTADMPRALVISMRIIGYYLYVSTPLAILVGFSLRQRLTWARKMALIVAAGSVLNLPFGTVLSVYTMWVLLPAGRAEEYASAIRTT